MPTTPSDNLYQDQWYLQELGGLERIWDDYTGSSVNVGIYDDGVDLDHHDLDDNYNANLEVVIGGVRVSGDTFGGDNGHGTAVGHRPRKAQPCCDRTAAHSLRSG